jgi:phage terminase small subunit
MPRKSANALMTVVPLPTPKPPTLHSDCSPEVRAVFNEIVSSVPHKHFVKSDAPLIERYATAIVNARRAQAMIEKHGLVDHDKPSPWTLVHEKAEKAIDKLSARLRLSPQSRMDRKSSRLQGRPSGDDKKPWRYDDKDDDAER